MLYQRTLRHIEGASAGRASHIAPLRLPQGSSSSTRSARHLWTPAASAAGTMDAISELQMLCQRLKQTPPRYEFSSAAATSPAASGFVCTLHMPVLDSGAATSTSSAQQPVQPANEQSFVGDGHTKKAAKAAAAQAALSALRTTPCFRAAAPTAPTAVAAAPGGALWAAVEQSLSDQGLWKEPMLRPYVLWAQAYGKPPGAVPISALLHARAVKAWLKAHAPEAMGNADAMTRALAECLLQERQQRQAIQQQQQQEDGAAAVAAAAAGPVSMQQAMPATDTAAATAGANHAGTSPMATPTTAASTAGTAGTAEAAASSIEVLGEGPGASVRRKVAFEAAGQDGQSMQRAVLTDEVESQQPALVLLPADASCPPQELHLTAGGDLLHKLAAVLGTEPSCLVMWGHVGHKVQQVASASKPTEQGPQPAALDGSLCPQTSAAATHVAHVQGQGQHALLSGSDEAKPAHTEDGVPGVHVPNMAQPMLYSKLSGHAQESDHLNLRASWLAGRAVHGDALLSLCRLSFAQGCPHEVAKWASYGFADFWRSTAAMFPAAEYVHGTPAPLLYRLPTVYRSHSSWMGPQPTKLLDNYCRCNAWRCSQSYSQLTQASEGSDSQRVGTATLEVVAFGSGEAVQVHAEHESQAIAQCQAALAMLHELDRIDAAALLGQAKQQLQQAQGCNQAGEATELEVLEPGEPFYSPPAAGLSVKVDAHLTLAPTAATASAAASASAPVHVTASGDATEGAGPATSAGAKADTAEAGVLFRGQGLRFELGCGAVLPALEAAVLSLRINGRARCRVPLVLEGPDPLGKLTPVTCTLHVHLLRVTHPAQHAQHQAWGDDIMPEEQQKVVMPPLFDPPLSVQRYEWVAQMLQDSGVSALLDLGCGEGRLIGHLLCSCTSPSLQRIIGMDCSTDALRRASTRLDRLVTKHKSTMTELPLLQQAGERGWQLPGQQEQQGQQGQHQQQKQQQKQQAQEHEPDGWESCEQEPLWDKGSKANSPAVDGSSAMQDAVPQHSSRDQDGQCEATGSQPEHSKGSSAVAGSQASKAMEGQHEHGGRSSLQEPGAVSGSPSSYLLQQHAQQEQQQALIGRDASSHCTAANAEADSSSRAGGASSAATLRTTPQQQDPHASSEGWSAEVTLLHGSFAAPRLCQSAAWDAFLSSNQADSSVVAASNGSSGSVIATNGAAAVAPSSSPTPSAATAAADSSSFYAAALVEVIEHLDPGPLALAAPALLGGLRPQLAFVTTPNYEYNRVLHAAAAAGTFSTQAADTSSTAAAAAAGMHSTPAANASSTAAAAAGVDGSQAADACSTAPAGAAAAAAAGASADVQSSHTVGTSSTAGAGSPEAAPSAHGADATPGAAAFSSSPAADDPEAGSSAHAGYVARIEQAVMAANAAYQDAIGKQRLRDSDHRFEWTRKGFRAWARDAAEAFGYDVSFHDIGRALAEAAVLGAKAWEVDRDVGAATQAAVFVRRQPPLWVSRPLVAWGPRRLARLEAMNQGQSGAGA